jgi:hypothetical protein
MNEIKEFSDSIRPSKTYKISKTPVGNIYITLSYDKNGNICEIFIRVGKSKSDFDNNIFELQGLANALGIMMSRALQDGYDLNRLVESLSGVNTGWHIFRWKGYSPKSLADLIACVIKYDLSLTTVNITGCCVNDNNGDGDNISNNESVNDNRL